MQENITIRLCKKCNIEKPFTKDNFAISKEKKFGLSYTCKKCKSEKQKEKGYKSAKHKLKIYKQRDNKKGQNFDIKEEYLITILNTPCFYCGFPSTGLDRIDNSKGHTEDNCVPCCKECNIARMDQFSSDEMIIIGEAIKQVKLNRIIKN